jgi:hypothetical protein
MRDAILHDCQQLAHPVFRLCCIDEVEIAVEGGSKLGHHAAVDPMRVGDDQALRRLAKDFRQAHDRHRAGGNHVGEHLPGTHRGKLVDITDEQQRRSFRNGAQYRPHQRHIDHRGFVDDEQVTA